MTAAFVAITAASVVVLLVGERSGSRWRGWAKAGASTGFIATALAAGALDGSYGRWVLVALCLGWVGDVALVSERPGWFRLGLAAFLLSHLAYVAAFTVLGSRAIAAGTAALVLLVPAVGIGRWLLPHVPRRMTVPVVAYIVVITAMVAAASGAASDGAPWPVLPAAAAFYVSDIGVARQRFVAPGFENRVVGLPLYYGAQVLFALSTGMAR